MIFSAVYLFYAGVALELIHSDIAGPFPVESLCGNKYYITFIDDHSRFTHIYPLKTKSQAFERFQEYKALVENQLNGKIKALRTDQEGEYKGHDFHDFLKQNGIHHDFSVPYCPQQNGLAESLNRRIKATRLIRFTS